MSTASEIALPDDDDGGGAGWITTFADLMSLLMCFFVLLLSFAELDLMKFKAIAGSMKLAFGVQREIRALEVPLGTSIVAQDFSAGKPQPTVVNEVRQQSSDDDKQSLDFTDALADGEEGDGSGTGSPGEGGDLGEQQARIDARALTLALKEEIEKGMIEIETEGATVVVRIREKGSFPSGSARFDPAFLPVADKLRDSLAQMAGRIAVAGHTDNVPISTRQYRSNWDLSSARAVSVVHALLEQSGISPDRIVAEGHGEAHPLADNATAEGRALNRRVEITVRQEPDKAAPGGNGETAVDYGAGAAGSDDANAVGEGADEAAAADVGESLSGQAPEAAFEQPSSPFNVPVPATIAPSLAPPPVNIAPAIFPSRPDDAPPSRLELIKQGFGRE